MIRRWPIRVRLAAAFTAMMALVLLAVAWVTLHQSREALDESTNAALSDRLGRLLAIGATPSGPGLPGGTEGGLDQILTPSGQLIATRRQAGPDCREGPKGGWTKSSVPAAS